MNFALYLFAPVLIPAGFLLGLILRGAGEGKRP